MRVRIISAHERHGGAAVAASRLCMGLREQGVDTEFVVQHAHSLDPAVRGPKGAWQQLLARGRSQIDALPLRRYPSRSADFSVNWLPRVAPRLPEQPPADLVHLHWINAGMMSLGDVAQLKGPVVWTLHDMWPLTGGCHYDAGCAGYQRGCGACPQLGSVRTRDLSQHRFEAKRQAVRRTALTVVAPSRWMADCARSSPIFEGRRIEVLRNGVDLRTYQPHERAMARRVLGLPQGHRLVLFGALNAAADARKGFDLLQAALGRLRELVSGSASALPGLSDGAAAGATAPQPLSLVVFGSSHAHAEMREGLPVIHLGHLNDDTSLALLYAACDVFVAPSRQENLPNTVAEALACGTPSVAFDIGGLRDLIDHQQTGYLARAFDTDELAQGIAWCLGCTPGLQTGAHRQRLREACRYFAERHVDLVAQTLAHLALYRELIEQARPAQRPGSSGPASAGQAPGHQFRRHA
jgi:glycosyltransferase involved in cell wall biosynthesis